MAHDYMMAEIILWIVVIVITGLGSLGMYLIYRKSKSNFTLGVALFFLLIMLSRILIMPLVYFYGYDGSIQYLLPYPTLLWLQIGFNVLSYSGVFILYLVLERYIINTKFIFSAMTLILLTLSIMNYFFVQNQFPWQIPFFIAVVLGFPIIYLNMAIKSSGDIRRNAITLALGMVLFELGMALSIPNAQALLWSAIMPTVVYEFLAPILQIIGTIIIYRGFSRHSE
jgi:hypothetical protein